MWWRIAQGFALVVLLFWAGAFSLYVFPGRMERVEIRTEVVPTAAIDHCAQMWQLLADARTDGAAASIGVQMYQDGCYQ
jgi:hypothetical protein